VALVITTSDPHSFTVINYGMVPFWSKEKILHFEAPIEGSEQKHTEEQASIKKKIIQHPSFRNPIRESHYLIPADYILTQSSRGEAYLLFSQKSKPFALAGVFDSWKESIQEPTNYKGFSILTVPSCGKLAELGIERLPLIIPQNRYKLWLKSDAALTEITSLMKLPGEKEINGYPINPKLFHEKSTSREICRPIEDFIFTIETTNYSIIAEVLKSFRYKRGLTHNKPEKEERIWRADF
jgi:putative SOS response-associated peptidase YedK